MGCNFGITKISTLSTQANRLAIGTAQFGLPYGIANQFGQVSLEDAASILKCAWDVGVDTLDTAMAYGTSEAVLGTIGIQGWRIITKLHPARLEGINNPMRIRQAVSESLARLGIPTAYGLLLHRPEILLGNHGEVIYEGLLGLKTDGVIKKIGLSIYAPEELGEILHRYTVDIIQAPLNILDRRLISSGWLDRLSSAGVEIHTRSAFLQGLLLMQPEQRSEKFSRWQSLWLQWQEWLSDNRITALQACLGFALSNSSIERVIVGVDNQDQLMEIFSVMDAAAPLPPASLSSEDIDLINPSRWSRL